jgi:hypothetical protein
VQSFSTDQSIYHDGNVIKISGTVNYDPDVPSVILQIITPDGMGIVGIANVIPKSDGSFSATFHAGGPTWLTAGTYTIKASYAGNLEKTIIYQKSSSTVPYETANDHKSSIDNARLINETSNDHNMSKSPTNNVKLTKEQSFIENPKLRVPGFPSLDNSPQYYIDRYNNEPNYRSWFDSQFPNYSISDVVGYQSTHISNFPSLDNSPQYYIDRYNNEPNYRSWFDSQFSGKTMYDVLGFSSHIPDWIKIYAKLWANGDMSNSEFGSALNFMIKNKIIAIQNSFSEHDSIENIPNWIRYDAQWWSDDLISQQEFINSLQYLLEKKIIEIH